MAKLYNIDDTTKKGEFKETFCKAIQSVNLNFFIGSGCSDPALAPLCNIENEIQEKINNGKDEEAQKQIFEFLKSFIEVSAIINDKPTYTEFNITLENYKVFLLNLSQVLFEREVNILPKQATIFSTNYDLFIKKAFEDIKANVKLNDGFSRSSLLSGCFRFSTTEFFNSTFNNGNIYNYRVQIPSINLIKLHGSLSWQIKDDEITFCVSNFKNLLIEWEKINEDKNIADIKKFNQKFSIILPENDKFKDTLLKQTHYDLFRIYANELDKENTILISTGFSFEDQHILNITRRALRNPTLKIIIFCYEKKRLKDYEQKFTLFSNVEIVYSESEIIDFAKFNLIMGEVLSLKDNVIKSDNHE